MTGLEFLVHCGRLCGMLVLRSLLLYWVSLAIIGTLTILFSSLLRSAAGAAFSALGAVAVLSVLSALFADALAWSPSRLSGYAASLLITGTVEAAVWPALAVTVVCAAAALTAAVGALSRRPSLD